MMHRGAQVGNFSRTQTASALQDMFMLQDLQETGLLDFVQQAGLLTDLQAGSLSNGPVPTRQQHWGTRTEGPGHASEEDAPHDHERGFITAAADMAAGNACKAVTATRIRLHKARTASHIAPKSHCQPAKHGNRRGRKALKTAADQSATRSSSKGLRHFSLKVCEKVESRGRTSYNQVADELVAELSQESSNDVVQYDEKNIRRRVYDAINVLMAMDIIRKEKKEIVWKGMMPTSSTDTDRLHSELQRRASKVEQKQAYLQDLIDQQKALKRLLERNPPCPSSPAGGSILQMPFILVQVQPGATVEVNISDDAQNVEFDFYECAPSHCD